MNATSLPQMVVTDLGAACAAARARSRDSPPACGAPTGARCSPGRGQAPSRALLASERRRALAFDGRRALAPVAWASRNGVRIRLQDNATGQSAYIVIPVQTASPPPVVSESTSQEFHEHVLFSNVLRDVEPRTVASQFHRRVTVSRASTGIAVSIEKFEGRCVLKKRARPSDRAATPNPHAASTPSPAR